MQLCGLRFGKIHRTLQWVRYYFLIKRYGSLAQVLDLLRIYGLGVYIKDRALVVTERVFEYGAQR